MEQGLAFEKILILLGVSGLVLLLFLELFVKELVNYEILSSVLIFGSPFALTLAACVNKNVDLVQGSPWGIFLISSSMFLTAPLMALLYEMEKVYTWGSLPFHIVIGSFTVLGWYILLTNKTGDIPSQTKVKPIFFYCLIPALLLLAYSMFGDIFI